MQKYLKTNSKHSQSLFDLVMFLTVTSFPLIDLKKSIYLASWYVTDRLHFEDPSSTITRFVTRCEKLKPLGNG